MKEKFRCKINKTAPSMAQGNLEKKPSLVLYPKIFCLQGQHGFSPPLVFAEIERDVERSVFYFGESFT